jgi:transcriptional regulator with PAS, ATPase and Fis domain
MELLGERPRGAIAEMLRSVELGPAGRIWVSARAHPVPSPPPGRPWIWLCGAVIPPAAAAEAALRGAYDCVSSGGRERLLQRLREVEALSKEQAPAVVPGLIAQSAAARRMLSRLTQAARTSQPVLLTGETGTGKELAARLIHDRSARSDGRFVPINCAAIPNDLMEGQLFGYARGAFSGAVRSYDGLVSAAQGGTVFLDEIDDTPHPLQVKLLRVLEDRIVNRLGENAWRKVDFRILAATNRDLRKLVEQGAFGADLYERLAVLAIHLPPLRERLEDLPALLHHLIERFYRDEAGVKKRVGGATPEAIRALEAYPWPGNIRELRNVVFSVLAAKRVGEEILVSDLPRHVLRRGRPIEADAVVSHSAIEKAMDAGSFSLRRETESLQRAALQAALVRTGGNVSQAAKLLGEIGRGAPLDPGGTVRAMIKRLGLKSG